jgi:hypothetical protein
MVLFHALEIFHKRTRRKNTKKGKKKNGGFSAAVRLV